MGPLSLEWGRDVVEKHGEKEIGGALGREKKSI
jgi:hypothetical protein